MCQAAGGDHPLTLGVIVRALCGKEWRVRQPTTGLIKEIIICMEADELCRPVVLELRAMRTGSFGVVCGRPPSTGRFENCSIE